MKNRPAAKSPSTAVARTLRDLGLQQGTDFQVKGDYARGERFGTRVALIGRNATQVVLDHADDIESMTSAEGFPFYVSIYRVVSGSDWAWISNSGVRERPQDENLWS